MDVENDTGTLGSEALICVLLLVTLLPDDVDDVDDADYSSGRTG